MTQALVGIPAKTIYVTGSSEAFPLLKKIANICGNDFEFKEYSRKTVNHLFSIPSNFFNFENNTLDIGKFKPMPIASVAIKTSVSPSRNLLDSTRLISGPRAPYIVDTDFPTLMTSSRTS